MATVIQQRRGTKAQHDDGSGFTGAVGEITVDTTDDTLRVHDGSLKGGHVIAKLSDVQASDTLAELSDTSITGTAAGHILIHDGSDSFDNKAVSGAITINSSGVTTLESGQALTNLGGGSGTTFLRKDGTFATPTNTTYSIQDGELSENNFTDDDHSKLNAIEASADVTDTANVVAALTAGTNVSIAGDGTISSTDTNTTYSVQDGELSQNSFTNDDHTKLNGIEASADVTDTTNVVAALTAGTNIAIAGNGTISATDTTYSVQDGELSQNNFTNDDHTKLNNIEAGADVTDATNVVAALTAGTNIAIAGNGTISSTNTTYTGGTGLTLSGTTFNVDAAQTGITSVGTLSGLVLGQNGTVSFEGSTSGDNDTILTVVDPTADRAISLPNASGTVALDGVNQTAYRIGEIIEVVTGYADGSTISGQATTAGVARNFALEDVTALQSLTTSYGKINGTLVNYLPPVGTKTLEIEYGIFVGYESPDTGIMHHKLNVGGTYVTNTRMTHRDDSALNKYVILKSILTVDGSGDVAAGNVDSWNSAIALQLDGREYGGSAEIKLHITHYYDGSTSGGNQVVVPPSVKITAIG
ncbi:hypothetical protein N9F71_00810 [bacterium]|nr:hypothetical protein [bacterium]